MFDHPFESRGFGENHKVRNRELGYKFFCIFLRSKYVGSAKEALGFELSCYVSTTKTAQMQAPLCCCFVQSGTWPVKPENPEKRRIPPSLYNWVKPTPDLGQGFQAFCHPN